MIFILSSLLYESIPLSLDHQHQISLSQAEQGRGSASHSGHSSASSPPPKPQHGRGLFLRGPEFTVNAGVHQQFSSDESGVDKHGFFTFCRYLDAEPLLVA